MQHRSSVPLPYETPFYDRHTYRLTDGSGGKEFTGVLLSTRPPIEHVNDDGYGAHNDVRVNKHRGPWKKVGSFIPAADPIRWTDSGPIRPDLHFKTMTWRRQSGEFFQNRCGWHTSTYAIRQAMIANGGPKKKTNPNWSAQRGLQNKLTSARYRGQTYSQTTKTLGGAMNAGVPTGSPNVFGGQ